MYMMEIKNKAGQFPWLVPGGMITIEDGQYFLHAGNEEAEITYAEFEAMKVRVLNAGGVVLVHPEHP